MRHFLICLILLSRGGVTSMSRFLQSKYATAMFVCQVLFLDPVQEETVELVKLAELFYKHKIPLRLVPLRRPAGPHLTFLIWIRFVWSHFYCKIECACLSCSPQDWICVCCQPWGWDWWLLRCRRHFLPAAELHCRGVRLIPGSDVHTLCKCVTYINLCWFKPSEGITKAILFCSWGLSRSFVPGSSTTDIIGLQSGVSIPPAQRRIIATVW